MVQLANALEAKTEDLSLIPGVPTMEGKNKMHIMSPNSPSMYD